MRFGAAFKFGDVVGLRPIRNTRANAAIFIVKAPEPFIIDCGTNLNPGFNRLKQVYDDFDAIKYIFVTHSHYDHSQGLKKMMKLCPNAKVFCHENDKTYVSRPITQPVAWSNVNAAFPLIPKKAYNMFGWSASRLFRPNINFHTITNNQKVGDAELIWTPGHSPGHLCIKYDNCLFLADLVPFTPWIEPNSISLEQMLNSIQIVLEILPNVDYAIRSHPDYRLKNWDVVKADEEITRFEEFYKTILNTREKILLHAKKEIVTTESIAMLVMPKIRKHKSLLKRTLWMGAISWAQAYLLDSERSGSLLRVSDGWIYNN